MSNEDGDGDLVSDYLSSTLDFDQEQKGSDNFSTVVIDDFTWPIVLVTVTSGMFRILCDVIAHITILIITVVVSRQCFRLGLRRTAEHAFYCTVAFVSLTSEALVIGHCWWMLDLIGARYCVLLHMALGILALSIGLLGIILISFHRRKKAKHLQPNGSENIIYPCLTKHGALGVCGCILNIGSLGTGVSLIFVSNMPLHLTHRICGLLGFFILMFCQWYAYNMEFVRRHWRVQSIRLLKWSTLIATIATSYFHIKVITRDIVLMIPKKVFRSIAINERPTHASHD